MTAGTYGNSACADNCCRFNCCWKQGALPVEDYPIANSTAADQTQKMDGEPKKDTEGEGLPKYEATPQMSAAAPAVTEAEGSRAGAETVTEEVEREKKASA